MTIIANIKFNKEEFDRDQAQSWARRHGYRVTTLEESDENYIFWQDTKTNFEGRLKSQHIKDGVSVSFAERNNNVLLEGVYPEEDPNGRKIIVKDNYKGNIFYVRAKSLAQAKYIVSKNEKIPMMNLEAWFERKQEGGWWMGIGGQQQDVPSNPANRATPPGDIHNYPGGKPPIDMMRNKELTDIENRVIQFLVQNPNPKDADVHNFAAELGLEPDEFEAVFYKVASMVANLKGGNVPDSKFDAKQLAMGIKVELEHTDDPDVAKMIAKAHLLEIPDYYTRLKKMEDEAKTGKEEAKLSPSSGQNIQGGDDYMTGKGDKHMEANGANLGDQTYPPGYLYTQQGKIIKIFNSEVNAREFIKDKPELGMQRNPQGKWEVFIKNSDFVPKEQKNIIATFDDEQKARDWAKQMDAGLQKTLDGKWAVVRKEKRQIVYEAGINTYYD